MNQALALSLPLSFLNGSGLSVIELSKEVKKCRADPSLRYLTQPSIHTIPDQKIIVAYNLSL